MAAEELEAIELLLAESHPGSESDDAGALLRRLLARPRDEVRVVHPRPLRAQRGWHERRADADCRRVAGRGGRPHPVLSGVQACARTANAAGQGVRTGLPELRPPLT